MARREPVRIALGERSFEIRALTIDQMQGIEAALEAHAGRRDVLPFATRVLGIALERDHPQDAVGLGTIECEVSDVSRALQTVLRHGGFIPGEAPAAAGTSAPPSTGDGSGAASPPPSA